MEGLMDEGVSMVVGEVKPAVCPSSQSDGTLATDTGIKHNDLEFLHGFVDCARESIRFLTEVEGMSPDHPFIQGLHADLRKRLHLIQIQLILKQVVELQNDDLDYDHDTDEDLESCADDTDNEYVDEQQEVHNIPQVIDPQQHVNYSTPEQYQQQVGNLANPTHPAVESVKSAHVLDAEEAFAGNIAAEICRFICEVTEESEVSDLDIDTSQDEGYHEH